MKLSFKRLKYLIFYAIYFFSVLIIADVVLFKYFLGFGYPTHYRQESVFRSPAPYVEFTAKPNVASHNEFGFKGKSYLEADSTAVKIAFFGGSTGYVGSPPICNILEEHLEKLWRREVFIANYSVICSNHRQHLHGILEYAVPLKPDIVLFYGGNNETQQHIKYDPRPGYPYNYFYRGELGPFRKLLLRYSAILGEIDMRFGIVSGIGQLRSQQQPLSPEWNEKIAHKYFETLHLANAVSNTLESSYFGKCKFFAFYQPFRVPESFLGTHYQIRQEILEVPYIFDVSSAYNQLGKEEDIFIDEVHVQQPARELMAETMAKALYNSLGKF